jgi:hypothetical protein
MSSDGRPGPKHEAPGCFASPPTVYFLWQASMLLIEGLCGETG